MRRDTDRPPVLGFASHARNGCTIAALSGELDILCVPTLRGQLLNVLRPDVGRLIVDLSRVNFCDASGLAVLIGARRRAELLGGVLHLVAPTPPVMLVMRITGLHRRLDIFSTVLAATTSPGSSAARTVSQERARSLVSALTRRPLTHSPAGAAAASGLRRIVEE